MTLPHRLVLATGNPGKVAEWRELLAGSGVELLTPRLASPDEDAATYAANAALKARAAAVATGLCALGDDVGIEVEALGGAPGLYTRRWAESVGGWAGAADTLLADALGSPATYHCGLAIAWPDGRIVEVTGVVRGRIGARGGPGPGLEPVFWPDGAGSACSDLRGEARQRWHHRDRALAALLAYSDAA